MKTATQSPRTTLATGHGKSAYRQSLLLRLLNWLADADARYRQAQKLRNLPDERLNDMGLTRQDADTAFRR